MSIPFDTLILHCGEHHIAGFGYPVFYSAVRWHNRFRRIVASFRSLISSEPRSTFHVHYLQSYGIARLISARNTPADQHDGVGVVVKSRGFESLKIISSSVWVESCRPYSVVVTAASNVFARSFPGNGTVSSRPIITGTNTTVRRRRSHSITIASAHPTTPSRVFLDSAISYKACFSCRFRTPLCPSSLSRRFDNRRPQAARPHLHRTPGNRVIVQIYTVTSTMA
ncbi:hypothetical protein EDB86DRAFT_1340536 [Lactarius hatsudake]|nr:hypothetical protein EDB86DRAFT_1340536 [Lactarius hatsudake]